MNTHTHTVVSTSWPLFVYVIFALIVTAMIVRALVRCR
jgi:hypothetical protein